MEDTKVAGILADEFNKLSREEEVNREDEEWLELLRDKKRYLCNVMDILGVSDLIDFEHKAIAHLKSGIEKPLVREGYWKQRVYQVAKVLVDSHNDASETLKTCVLSFPARLTALAVRREAAKYLKLLGLGLINTDGTAVVRVERIPMCDEDV